MKHTIERTKDFTPITLTITIESEQELMELWGRFNLNDVTVQRGNYAYFQIKGWDGAGRFYDLWDSLDKEL